MDKIFTVEEVRSALQHVPAHKAAPKGCAPGILWKVGATAIAPHLWAYLGKILDATPITIPSLWKDAWLSLLVKPNKSIRRPEALRPIGLQLMEGKALLRMLCGRMKPSVQVYAAEVPQMAYLPQRECLHALLRAFARCNEGVKPQELVGGCALSLDFSQAFDRLPC